MFNSTVERRRRLVHHALVFEAQGASFPLFCVHYMCTSAHIQIYCQQHGRIYKWVSQQKIRIGIYINHRTTKSKIYYTRNANFYKLILKSSDASTIFLVRTHHQERGGFDTLIYSYVHLNKVYIRDEAT